MVDYRFRTLREGIFSRREGRGHVNNMVARTGKVMVRAGALLAGVEAQVARSRGFQRISQKTRDSVVGLEAARLEARSLLLRIVRLPHRSEVEGVNAHLRHLREVVASLEEQLSDLERAEAQDEGDPQSATLSPCLSKAGNAG